MPLGRWRSRLICAVAFQLLLAARVTIAQTPPGEPAETAETPPEEAAVSHPRILFGAFGNIDYRYEDTEIPNTFALGQLDFFLTTELATDVSLLAEVVFEATEGSEERIIDVERYQIKYSPSDAFNVVLGRMHTELGYWNQAYHHGTWFQTTAYRPEVYRFEDEDGVLPIHEVGLRLFGATSAGGLRVEYNASLTNGRAVKARDVVTFQDPNGHKAVNLWLGLSPRTWTGFKFGGVFHEDRIAPDPTRPSRANELSERIWGGFVVYQRRPIELLAEAFAIHHEDRVTGERFKTTGLYAQAAYGFGLVKPYYRFDLLDGAAADPYYAGSVRDARKHTVGIRSDPWSRVAVKLDLSHDRPISGESFNAVTAQVAVTF
jgi:hypothetical protein